MKPIFNHILRTGVLAAALASSSVGASAGTTHLSATLHGGPQFTATGGGFGGNAVTPGIWSVNSGASSFWAFCIEPAVAFNGAANDYTSGTFAASDAVKRLYESYYNTVLNSNLNNPAPKAKAFQLALWELNNDNGNLLSGNLRFNNLSHAVVADANAMLVTALGSSTIFNIYQYTSWNSDAAGTKSQRMLTVSAAVPEPETYALMLAGLGLIAGVARRRSKQL